MSKKISNYNIQFRREGATYIYNSLTKAIVRSPDNREVNEVLLNFVQEEEGNRQPELKSLVDNGFLVDEKVQEVELLEYLFKKNYFDSSQLYLTLVPTLNCNLNCPYCFEKAYRDDKRDPSFFKAIKLFGQKYLNTITILNSASLAVNRCYMPKSL